MEIIEELQKLKQCNDINFLLSNYKKKYSDDKINYMRQQYKKLLKEIKLFFGDVYQCKKCYNLTLENDICPNCK